MMQSQDDLCKCMMQSQDEILGAVILFVLPLYLYGHGSSIDFCLVLETHFCQDKLTCLLSSSIEYFDVSCNLTL